MTAINTKPIKHVNEIYEVLSDAKIRLLKMTVVRDGRKLELNVTPEDVT